MAFREPKHGREWWCHRPFSALAGHLDGILGKTLAPILAEIPEGRKGAQNRSKGPVLGSSADVESPGPFLAQLSWHEPGS